MGGELTPYGMSDAQSVLLEKLGFSAQDANRPGVSLVPINIGAEEEWISSRFDINPDLVKTDSSLPFTFYLMPVSRQVSLRAIEHGFGVRPLPIDGVDPLKPETIYSGEYPFTRKIYLLMDEKASNPHAQELVDFLLSSQGQEQVSSASFLPMEGEE
jgi:hypothetical protein